MANLKIDTNIILCQRYIDMKKEYESFVNKIVDSDELVKRIKEILWHRHCVEVDMERRKNDPTYDPISYIQMIAYLSWQIQSCQKRLDALEHRRLMGQIPN